MCVVNPGLPPRPGKAPPERGNVKAESLPGPPLGTEVLKVSPGRYRTFGYMTLRERGPFHGRQVQVLFVTALLHTQSQCILRVSCGGG